MDKSQKTTLLIFLYIAGIIATAGITYTYFPQEKIIEVEKTIEVTKIVEVPEIVEVEKIINYCPNDKPRMERHKAYVIENGELKEAGSHYKNEPSECAKLHNRSLC